MQRFQLIHASSCRADSIGVQHLHMISYPQKTNINNRGGGGGGGGGGSERASGVSTSHRVFEFSQLDDEDLLKQLCPPPPPPPPDITHVMNDTRCCPFFGALRLLNKVGESCSPSA